MAKKRKPAGRKPAVVKKKSAAAGKRRRPIAGAAVAAGTGPVSLSEAKSIVQAESPGHGVRSAAVTAAITPATVGAARENLELQRKQELERRVLEYKATLSLMKQRGVKGLKSKRAGPPKKHALEAPQSGQPLQIFAEGDSWFDYPVPFFGGGVIPRLEDRLGVPILNLAKAGDEVRYMLGVEEREILTKHFTNGCPAGGDWDVMLFSGGGNDIVGNPMALWIKDFDPAAAPADLIHKPRFAAALSMVSAGYEDLIAMRDAITPNTHLVFHAYDFAIPDGRGICHLGPWLKPTFDLRGFPTRATAFEVVKLMLKQFAAMLDTLQKNHRDVTFINGQGTLTAEVGSWHNELHPSKAGFKVFADVFHQKLKAIFPGRVL